MVKTGDIDKQTLKHFKLNKEDDMSELEQDIRWLRTKLAEAKDKTEKQYILKQLELLEAKEAAEHQTLLSE